MKAFYIFATSTFDRVNRCRKTNVVQKVLKKILKTLFCFYCRTYPSLIMCTHFSFWFIPTAISNSGLKLNCWKLLAREKKLPSLKHHLLNLEWFNLQTSVNIQYTSVQSFRFPLSSKMNSLYFLSILRRVLFTKIFIYSCQGVFLPVLHQNL